MKGAKRTGLRPALQGIPVMPDSEKFRGGEAGSRRIGRQGRRDCLPSDVRALSGTPPRSLKMSCRERKEGIMGGMAQ
ncbi:MAG: hypothetical protein CO013_09710 [Syntrophobacterales bacterium CG_4_8_14_3_um_filter_58_8]|nr:MAG: hypothetical protein COS57_15765 [Syntrophobacterales bacterium CG03_land_8_20_14_0_80_58_14]PJC72348.1 MAG: hypothetical protein CO013_09710 [Syntrophobacterales bacterium CG_4_8_14_3_um_filter_58_8]